MLWNSNVMVCYFKKMTVLFLLITICPREVLCGDGFYQTSAEESQSVACQLDAAGGSAGHINFNFRPLPTVVGVIEYNGLFSQSGDKYYAIVHRVELTKLVGSKDVGYTFEGVDQTIGGGAVRGTFKNDKDFEISGYFSKSYSDVECIYYRLSPFKSPWAKKIAEDNPKFQF